MKSEQGGKKMSGILRNNQNLMQPVSQENTTSTTPENSGKLSLIHLLFANT